MNESGRRKHGWILFVVTFAVMIAVFVGSLTVVYMIPNERIEWHREYSLYTLHDIEEKWESFGNLFGLHSTPGMMDNTTDRVMLMGAYVEDESMSALEAALAMNEYARYWHGYQVFLRPLLVSYQIHQIRYLNMTVFFLLLFWVLSVMSKKLGRLEAVSFLLAMIGAHIVVIPMSMQFMAVFMVTMVTMLVLLYRYPFAHSEYLPLLFMVVGMVINFLDLLTTPIVTLGVPLLLSLRLEGQTEMNTRQAARMILSCSVAWTLGYALCWMTKWVLVAWVLGWNLTQSVHQHIQYWAIEGDKSVSRLNTAWINFKDYFLQQGIRTMVFPVLFLLLLCVLACVCSKKGKHRVILPASMLAVSLYPYIWYMALSEHSWLHNWFTYRAQTVTQMGLYFAVIMMIDREKLNALNMKIRKAIQRKP